MMNLLFYVKVAILTVTTVLQIWAYPDADSKCLGNILRLSLDGSHLAGRQIHVDVPNGSDVITITPFLATQCGFSMNSDPWGNTLLYVSLQHCYAQSRNDGEIEINLQLRPHGQQIHTVSKSCPIPKWTSREILCSHNFMEVSVEHDLPTSEQLAWMMSGVTDAPSTESDFPLQSTSSPFRLKEVKVYAPAEETLSLAELQRQGYGLSTSPTRLLIRGPHNTSASYFQDVARIPMAIMRTSVVYKYRWMLFLVNAAAACPAGGVSFTEDQIIWRLPRHIAPLLSTSSELIEAYMGIDGQRLDEDTLKARGYLFYATDDHFQIEMPIGSPDGYYKSHVYQGRYHFTYSIEPMVELLWRETGGSEDETRYKVLFPISTQPLPRLPHVIDYTLPEEGRFSMILGTFLPDVDLINITTDSVVMTMPQAAANGFDIQQNIFPNGSIAFSLEVPFTHPAVIKQNPNVTTTTYTLELGFVFVVLPEETVFSHPVILETAVADDDQPSVTGSCDQKNFYIIVWYGSKGHNFETLVGGRLLNAELAQRYNSKEYGSHFTMKVPFGSPEIAFEVVQSSFVRARIDVTLQDSENGWNITYYSRACTFFTSLIECRPNGTVEAIAIKVEAVPSLDPQQLSLNDPSCGPAYSDDHFALFNFRVDSCGTTREFKDGVMVYKNRASLKDGQNDSSDLMQTEQPKYRFTFSCEYSVNASKTVAYFAMPPSAAPTAGVGVGELVVAMKLSKGAQYADFYSDGDYPVETYLQQSLYFELELVQFKDANVELIIDRCWATPHEDRTSKQQWDIIVDGCPNPEDTEQTVFHTVFPGAKIRHPSLFKRFEVKMFSFAVPEDAPPGQVVFHCDVVICDSTSPFNGLCHGQCAAQQKGANSMRRGPRAVSELHTEHVSSGLIFLLRE